MKRLDREYLITEGEDESEENWWGNLPKGEQEIRAKEVNAMKGGEGGKPRTEKGWKQRNIKGEEILRKRHEISRQRSRIKNMKYGA